jgi:CBS domain-containing protein
MDCERVMQNEVYYVRPTDTAQSAARTMRQENIGFLPVCDEEGVVLGTVTDRDLALRLCAEAIDAARTPVADVMTREVIACRPEDDLTTAEHLMARHKISRVLVVDEAAHLVGVITIADVAVRDSDRHTAHTLRKIVEREVRP